MTHSYMPYSRRQFLAHSALGIGLGAVSGLWQHSLHAAPLQTNHRYLVGTDDAVCLINLDTKNITHLQVGFKPHSFTRNPHHPSQMMTIEKWGSRGAIIQFEDGKDDGKLIQRINCPENYLYFGHVVFSPFDQRYLATRVDMTTGKGYLIGFDAQTFKQVSEHNVSPGALHDCHFLPDNTLLVASEGARYIGHVDIETHSRAARSSLVQYDLYHDKVIKNIYADKEEQTLSHFQILDNGAIIALSTTANPMAHGNAFFCAPRGDVLKKISWSIDTDKKARGEVLSIAVDTKDGIAMLTNPDAKLAILINSATGEHIKTIDSVDARSIAYDPARGSFICGKQQLMFFDKDGNRQDGTMTMARNMPLAGSHAIMLGV